MVVGSVWYRMVMCSGWYGMMVHSVWYEMVGFSLVWDGGVFWLVCGQSVQFGGMRWWEFSL